MVLCGHCFCCTCTDARSCQPSSVVVDIDANPDSNQNQVRSCDPNVLLVREVLCFPLCSAVVNRIPKVLEIPPTNTGCLDMRNCCDVGMTYWLMVFSSERRGRVSKHKQ
ncbi:hypothetical protein BaRGS_00023480 [Batillaria attramentaria]|uniref:Secreted protein n=1 Tax=Batillaria attramentaria TaxID=370345 RepID=A0ABD0KDP2_9CAEN